MNQLQKRLILIACFNICAAPLYGMDHLRNALSTVSTTSSSLWGNDTFRKAVYAYATLCLVREAYAQYYNKEDAGLPEKIGYTLVKTPLQAGKIPYDVTTSCIKYCWNILQNNPRTTTLALQIPSSIASGLVTSYLVDKMINSSAINHLGITSGTSDVVKNEWMRLLYQSTDSMLKPLFHSVLHNKVLGDPEKRYENLVKGELNGNKESHSEEIDFTKHVYFGKLASNLQKFLDDLNSPYKTIRDMAPKNLLLRGLAGNGKSVVAVELFRQMDLTKAFSVHSGSMDSIYMSGASEKIGALFADIKKLCIDNPNKTYGLFIDEIDNIASTRMEDTIGSSNKEANKATNRLMGQLDEMKQLPNFRLICATNRPTDGAARRRLELAGGWVSYPHAEQRKDMLEGYIKKYNLTIDSKTLQLLVTDTEAFTSDEITKCITQVCIDVIKNNTTQINYSHHASIIDTHLQKCLNFIYNTYTKELVTAERGNSGSSEVQETLQECKKALEACNRTKHNLNKRIFDQLFAAKYQELKATKDQHAFVRLTQECLGLLEEQKKSLSKTPEQEIFEQMITALNKGDVSALTNGLQKFDATTSMFETSLNKQSDVLDNIIIEIQNASTCESSDTLRKINLAEKIKHLIDKAKMEVTYYSPDNKKYPSEEKQEQLFKTIVDYCADKITDCSKILQDLEALKQSKQDLDKTLRSQVLKLQETIDQKDITLTTKVKRLKKEIAQLSNMIVTTEQRNIHTLINSLDIEKNSTLTIDEKNIDFGVIGIEQVEIKEEITPVETKPEVQPQTRKLELNKKPKPQRTSSLDGLELYVPKQSSSPDIFEIMKKADDLKTYENIIQQKSYDEASLWWKLLSYCKTPKVSEQQKSASGIAFFLQQWLANFASSTSITCTPDSLASLAQALQETGQSEVSQQRLLTLLAGYQHADKQVVDYFGKPKTTKDDVKALFDGQAQRLCVQSEKQETIDADAQWFKDNAPALLKNHKKFELQYKVTGQQPKKVVDQMNMLAAVKQLERLTQGKQ